MKEKLKVYTDSSTVGDVAAATTIIVTDTQYIGMFTDTYEVASATEGELLSVLQSIKFLREHDLTDRQISIYCDCMSVVNQLKEILCKQEIPEDIKYRKRWVELFDLCSGLDVTAHHVRGHQESHNFNKVCDKLSNSVVQRWR